MITEDSRGTALRVLLAFVLALALSGCAAGIARDDLFVRLRDGTAPMIVDVRTQGEYDRDHIPGAVRIPFYAIGTRLEEMGVPKTEPVVLYCEHGPRAGIGAFLLRLAGYESVYSLDGHMKGWRIHSLPRETREPEPAAGTQRKSSSVDPFNTVDGSLEIVQEPIFGGRAAVYEAGRGHARSVVLIHGLGDNGMQDWSRLIPVLARKYHVVAFDLPGFGRSSRQNALYSPERYADFVNWIVRKYVQGPFIAVGHSLGGAVALKFAAAAPEGLERLVVVDAAGILHRVALSKCLLRIGENNGTSGSAEKVNDLTRAMLDAMETKSVTAGIENVLADPALRLAVLGGSPARIASLALISDDFSAELDRIRVPVLILWGERDAVSPVRTAKVLAARLPSARFELIRNAGHSPMLDQPERFNDLLLAEFESGGDSAPKPVPPADGSSRTGVCSGKQGMRFTGDYDLLSLKNCRGVEIRDASVRRLEASGSEAVIENTKIAGEDAGLRAFRSELTLTNVDITGNVALKASRSRLDLAGVRLEGRTSAVTVEKESFLVFSVSRTDSPVRKGYMHGSSTVQNTSY
ncbi:MAG TPA: alpha/beta fold hydrolase [Nitrospirota bacterium]|nr:alpha/beta fold hydrolase [Nitrospirota bacterium]